MYEACRGYIKLWRKSLGSVVWQCPDLWRAWTCCLMLANHKDGYVKMDRLAEPVLIKPGQFITGRFAFHEAMYPKKRRENKSPSTVWRWLQTLEKLGNVNIQMNSRFSIITIVNWDTYQQQDFQNEQQFEQQVNSRRTAGEQQVNTNKNGKNGKKDISMSSLPLDGDTQQSLPQDKIPYADIVNHLNAVGGTSFKPTTRDTKGHIKARWQEGHRLPDFLAVISHKADEWLGDAKMQQFVRPQTLFGTKFESYLQAAKAAGHGENRPQRGWVK